MHLSNNVHMRRYSESVYVLSAFLKYNKMRSQSSDKINKLDTEDNSI